MAQHERTPSAFDCGALYPTSAYALPELCARLGLSAGNSDEAFASKRRYVTRRLRTLPEAEVIEVARKVFQETGDDQLQAAIEKYDSDSDVLRITDVTRCHLAEALNTFELAGRQDLVELLRKHWPSIDSTRSSQDLDAMLIDDIYQHAVRNNDWDNAEVLKQVGWLTCSQTRLFEVLEDVLHPIRRDTAEQGQMVTKLNPILSRDGYLLVPGQPISGHRTYVVQQVAATGVHPADAIISETMMLFDENAVQHAWKKALDRRGTDPEGAVTPPGPCWRQFASTS